MLLNEFQIADKLGDAFKGTCATDLALKRRVRSLVRDSGIKAIEQTDAWFLPESRIGELLEALCSRSSNEKDRHTGTSGGPAGGRKLTKALSVTARWKREKGLGS